MNAGIFRLQLFKRSETFVAAQAEAMRRFHPVYIGRREFGPAPDGADVAVLPSGGRIANARQLIASGVLRRPGPFVEALRSRKIDIIHCHFAVDAVYALPVARKLNVPLVTTLHGFDVTRTDAALLLSGRPALMNAVLHRRSLQKNGDLFICVSDFIRRKAIERGFPEDRAVVHYIGIDVSSLSVREGPGEAGLIVQVGRLVEKKGTEFLLRAVAEIRRQSDRPVRLVLIGEGPLRSKLEQQCHALALDDVVSFMGAQPHDVVLGWIRRAAVLAVPSVTASDGDSEGLPIVNLEASSQGVPLVASVSGGIAEAVVHDVTGLLHAERDVAAMAAHLADLLGNPVKRVRFGQNGRQLMEKSFDIRKQSALLEELYLEALGRRRRNFGRA